jgi:hypothetical protein
MAGQGEKAYYFSSNSKRLSKSFLIDRNKDFDEKISSNKLFNLLSKYSYLLF